MIFQEICEKIQARTIIEQLKENMNIDEESEIIEKLQHPDVLKSIHDALRAFREDTYFNPEIRPNNRHFS